MYYVYLFLLNLAIVLNQAGLYDESLSLLDSYPQIQNVSYEQYHFYRACSAYSVKNFPVVEDSANKVVNSFNSENRRYRLVALGMLLDSKNDKDKLRNIANDMEDIADRMKVAKGGPKTQSKQKIVVEKLDREIKSLEDSIAKSNSNGDGQDGSKGKGGQSKSPAEQSGILENGGPGAIDQKKLKNYKENWGKMPAVERAKAISEMSKSFPSKYSQMIEDYYKSLNRNP